MFGIRGWIVGVCRTVPPWSVTFGVFGGADTHMTRDEERM
jgi:hypothetical protein